MFKNAIQTYVGVSLMHINSLLLCENMLVYLVCPQTLFEKRTVFQERSSCMEICELWGTGMIMSKDKYPILVYTTQVNSTFRACWLANSEVISQ